MNLKAALEVRTIIRIPPGVTGVRDDWDGFVVGNDFWDTVTLLGHDVTTEYGQFISALYSVTDVGSGNPLSRFSAVPEPGTVELVALGLLSVVGLQRRRRAS